VRISLKMELPEIILSILLVYVILANVKIAPLISVVKTGPGFAVSIGVVFYLFSKSPVLGVLAIIALYLMLENQFEGCTTCGGEPEVQGANFETSLEEELVKAQVPMINRSNSLDAAFSNSSENTHGAACAR
jgi:hypothetical protein